MKVKSLFNYELDDLMFNYFILINFKSYFKSINEVRSYLSKSSKSNSVLPKCNNKYGHKQYINVVGCGHSYLST